MSKRNWVGLILIISLIIGLIIYRIIAQNDLKRNGIIVQAKILSVNFGGKASGGFQCLIKYKGDEKELPSPSSLANAKTYFIGKVFPAMYAHKTNTLEILITPQDFEKFNIPFPDSLKWVMPYVLKQ